MPFKLKYQTISPLLKDTLLTCINAEEFSSFRLVGGTAISLYRGHRLSIDIDLFTDIEYGTIDHQAIHSFLEKNFKYIDSLDLPINAGCKSYAIGKNKNEAVKLDLCYTDSFIDNPIVIDGIRLASLKDLIAMKVDVILRGGRKKDFWDINELTRDYSLSTMLGFHKLRYPYAYNESEILFQMTNFTKADEEFDPICLRGNYWELIKLDLIDFVKNHNSEN